MNRRAVSAILRVLLAAVILACACLPAFAENNDSAQLLVEQAVRYYAENGRRNKRVLAKLANEDPALAEKWEKIMDIWDAPVQVNSHLPDDLPDDDTLCLVALGYQLNPDGSMRDELLQRLVVLLMSARKYPNAVIVCTGGATASRNPDVTEAGRMSEWLIQNGVDPGRIFVEDQSYSTAENAIFTMDILEKYLPRVTQIAIISSDYHIATGVLLYGAEAILRGLPVSVVSNAAWHAPSGSMSVTLQANSLIRMSRELADNGE